MSGIDIPLEFCEIILHQPSLKEIAFIGEEDFFLGLHTICIDKSLVTQDKNVLSNLSNFQIFMEVIQNKNCYDKRQAVEQVFTLLFFNKKVNFTPNSILISSEKIVYIDEKTFDDFQDILREMFCLNSANNQSSALNPAADDRSQAIARKMMENRERIAKIKQNDKESFVCQYISILTIGLNSMSLYDVLNLTLYQFYDLIERYSLYINWDLDIRAKLAGSTEKTEIENWMKNIH